MKQIKVLVIILFLLLIVVLSVQNYAALTTKIHFKANLLFFDYQTADLSIFLDCGGHLSLGCACDLAFRDLGARLFQTADQGPDEGCEKQ